MDDVRGRDIVTRLALAPAAEPIAERRPAAASFERI
jgi:hypothetical protein